MSEYIPKYVNDFSVTMLENLHKNLGMVFTCEDGKITKTGYEE